MVCFQTLFLFEYSGSHKNIFFPSFNFFHGSVNGFIMDQYCIDLGVLLDNPSIVTLENPGAHSLHWYDCDLCWIFQFCGAINYFSRSGNCFWYWQSTRRWRLS